ncbi:hypothetical protein QWJ06_04005 [Kocuria rhizophila]|uniref:hypothetical protein n=1 Tax=Kocuria rhizophila TaxID=72000 RepID=UPI000C878D8F|nr:hypothetical protein [Kocuria rhizophila]MBO4144303.1 hypothetical protein [Kocuria rhizophila]MCT1958447.1 hypothetical protein [Kocuria rhizophila]MCT2074403.1 hypothetical protein [Kocuria rhizophila]MDN3225880.1 hypothetical protein [Kocuria rhizophila]PMR90515.1 hypothetical protein C1H83_07790 [Kocuria rhizophila]
MQDSPHRGTPPHDRTPGSPDPSGRSAADSARVKLAATAAGLAVLASAFVSGDVWATVLGIVLAVAGVVLGIVALSQLRGSAVRALVISLSVIAILWGTLNAFGGGSRLLVWPASEAFQECTDRALTLSSTSQCQQQLTDNVWRHLSGDPVETGFPTQQPSPDPSASASPSPSATTTGTGSPTAAPSSAASGTPTGTPST